MDTTREGTAEAVALAALLLDTRFAVLRLANGTVIANDDGAPLADEKALAAIAVRRDEPVVILTPEDLTAFEAIRLFAVVPLRAPLGHLVGTLTVLDGANRQITWTDRQVLMKLGEHILRLTQVDALIAAATSHARRLEVLLDSMPVAAYMMENDKLAYINAQFARTLGYSRAELMAMSSPAGVIVAEQQTFVREIIRRRQAGDHHDIRYVTQVRCRDGTILDAEIHGSVVTVDGRRVLIGVAVDVSEHARERRRVQEREEYFRALTENASDVTVILDETGVISYVTPSAERVFGMTPDELTGTKFDARIHPDDRDRFNADFGELVLFTDPSTSTSSFRFRCKNGSYRSLESVGTNLLRHPHVRGIVLNTRDITDRKALEEQIEQLHRLTSLGRLSAQVAHEFNNVLMGIQPVTEVIGRRYQDDPQLCRVAESIRSSIARGKRITTDILRFGRPAQPTLDTVNVDHLLRQTSDEIRTMMPETISLRCEVVDRPLFVCADAAQLSQVLINLALNARDAMGPGGGTLTFTARRGEPSEIPKGHDYVHFTVSDTGEGIADEHLPYIFEPLFSTKKTGTGLGLSVVWQVVAAHRGNISVESQQGRGTTFHIHIPAVATSAEQEHAEDIPQEETAKSVRILLVEDETAVAEGLCWSLEAEGFRVDVASTAAEVLSRFARPYPDVVILDLSLPDDDGRAVYERLFADTAVPVIFSSGHAREDDIASILQKPRTAFLMKPYSTEELLRTINQLLQPGARID